MPKLSLFTKAAYGLGQLAEGVKNTSFELFVFFYYNQVLGLSGGLAGLATGLALVVDAVTDPMAGSLSDNLQHRWGRRHPFIYAAALPLAVSFLLLFHPPAGMGQPGLFFWLFAFSVATRIAMTVYHVPHLALGAELSDDYRERTTIVAWRTVFAVMGSALAAVVGFAIYFRPTAEFPNRQLDPSAYPAYSWLCAVAMAVAVLGSAAGTHSRIPFLRAHTDHPDPFSLRRVWSEMRVALSNPSFRALFLGLVVFFVMRGVQTTLGLHMGTYFWRVTTEQILGLNGIVIVGLIIGVPFWTVASRHLDKRPTFLFGVVVFSLFNSLPPLFEIAGWFPAHESADYFPTLLVGSFLAAFGAAAGLVAAGSMMADITDEHELTTGRRQEGIFFGALAFAGKSASGIGHQVAGLGLEAIRFPAKAAPDAVPAETVVNLGILFGPGIAILSVISLFFLVGYRLDRERHRVIVEALENRRDAGGAAARRAVPGAR